MEGLTKEGFIAELLAVADTLPFTPRSADPVWDRAIKDTVRKGYSYKCLAGTCGSQEQGHHIQYMTRLTGPDGGVPAMRYSLDLHHDRYPLGYERKFALGSIRVPTTRVKLRQWIIDFVAANDPACCRLLCQQCHLVGEHGRGAAAAPRDLRPDTGATIDEAWDSAWLASLGPEVEQTAVETALRLSRGEPETAPPRRSSRSGQPRQQPPRLQPSLYELVPRPTLPCLCMQREASQRHGWMPELVSPRATSSCSLETCRCAVEGCKASPPYIGAWENWQAYVDRFQAEAAGCCLV
jgi:hypothetical protein